jgi:hypothetical protein
MEKAGTGRTVLTHHPPEFLSGDDGSYHTAGGIQKGFLHLGYRNADGSHLSVSYVETSRIGWYA